jgi:hypothetical protein
MLLWVADSDNVRLTIDGLINPSTKENPHHTTKGGRSPISTLNFVCSCYYTNEDKSMELPFAVESSPGQATGSNLHQSDSSLVTASSQGSFINSGTLDSPLPPNTPQDVVLPRYDNLHHSQQPQISGQLLTPAEGGRIRKHDVTEPDVIDFTYVDVCETDEDEVTILLEGLGTHNLQQETHRGDVLAVILSGMQHGENETLVVSQRRTER